MATSENIEPKKPIELASSRIRRDPPAPPREQKAMRTYPTERETWTVVIGVLLFAIALAIITVGVSDFTSK